MARGFGIAALCAFMVCAGPAFAAPDDAPSGAPGAEDIKAAGEEFDLGKKAFKKKDWVEAAEHFEKADERAPSAAALELAMRARDKAGQLDRAASLAALALERHPDQSDLAKPAQALVKKAGNELHLVRVRCTPACDLVIESKLVHGRAATQRTLFVPPGNVTLRASWSGGRSKSSPVQATKGGSSEVSFEAPPEEKAAEPAAAGGGAAASAGTPTTGPGNKPPEKDQTTVEPSGGLPPIVFIVGVGITAVAGGITVWSGLDTQNNPGKDTVREKCAGQGEDCPEYQDGLKRQRRTNVLLGVTGVLAVGTGVIGAFFTDWSGKKREQASVEPFVGTSLPGTGRPVSLGARGRF